MFRETIHEDEGGVQMRHIGSGLVGALAATVLGSAVLAATVSATDRIPVTNTDGQASTLPASFIFKAPRRA